MCIGSLLLHECCKCCLFYCICCGFGINVSYSQFFLTNNPSSYLGCLLYGNKRAKHVRNRLYAIAAKVVQHGRQVIVKCQAQYYDLLRY
ncbi:hypothetical protein [uncultured Gammaproteobacteria bacterium]|nr:hypothetical protein [uncultured Gammaproteobacteria bacterium]